MLVSPLLLDLAQLAIRDRLQHSARRALVQQARAAQIGPVPRGRSAIGPLAALLVARRRLAAGLRAVATRLDPGLARGDAPLAVLKAR